MNSNAAFQLAKNESLNWNPNLKNNADNLFAEIKKIDDVVKSGIDGEITKQSLAKLNKTIDGIKSFAEIKYQRDLSESEQKVIWQRGSTKLLDYTDGDSPLSSVIFVPSLINKSYIFDLSKKRSMVGFFKKKGLNCYILDWGEPTSDEEDFGIEDYILNRLNPAIENIYGRTGRKVILVGYCMGGLLSLAASLEHSEKIKSLALLATPWDFKSADIEKPVTNDLSLRIFDDYLAQNKIISGDLIHQLLYLLRTNAVHEKYERFADMDLSTEQAKSFIEREHWLHDNMNMTAKVARESFINWAAKNEPINGLWGVNKMQIDPSKISVPTFISIARYDKIIPPLCASPLSALIHNSTTIYPKTGHIGMVAGVNAQQNLWLPLEKWIKGL